MALLYGTRRTASVRSKDYCTVGILTEETFNMMIKIFPEIKNRMRQNSKVYNDEWSLYKFKTLKNVDYLNDVPEASLSEIMFKLQVANFEAGAKIFNKGTECEYMYFIVCGEVEMFIEQSKKEYPLEVVSAGSVIG